MQDLETRNLIRRAIKEIEEVRFSSRLLLSPPPSHHPPFDPDVTVLLLQPRTWALFDKLREQFNQNGDASAIEGSDKLQSIFNPLNELYREKREVALERMEQLVRKNKDEFVIIVPE